MRPPAIEAHRLFRFFHVGDDETLALQGVSLTVEAGTMVAVTGPSGSGKSTLLACLAGLDDPDGGHVWIAGERLTRRSESARARLRGERIGLLFQTTNLVGHLSVSANLTLARRLAGRSADTDWQAAALAACGIAHRPSHRPTQLSGGELARAGLAVALANDPVVILADEPTGELDSVTGRQVMRLLRSRADAGAAVVVVTHSREVAGHADREIALVDGQVRA